MRKVNKIISSLLLVVCGFFIASTIDVEAAPIQVTAQYTGTTTNMIANENNAELIGLDQTIFNVITNKGSSSHEVGLNQDGTIRLYYSTGENKGTSMEIKVFEGYIIQAISYSIKASYSPDANIIVDNGEPVLYSGYTTGIQLDNIGASSVIIHNVNDTNVQMHISQIEITYTSIPIKSLPGASIRTEGIQGLRFDAEVLDGTNIQEKGFYLLKGEATIADLMESLATMLYNGKTVFKQAVPGVAPDGRFSIVLTGIPIKGYLDDITVIPYVVKTDSEVVYSNPIVRSVGQVAILMDQATQDPLPQGVQNVLNELENFYKGRYVGNNYEISEGVKDPVTNEYVNLDLYDIYNPTVTNITLPTPAAREGYTFNGWYNDSSHSGDPITTVATSSISNVATIYGKWTADVQLPEMIIDWDFGTKNKTGYAAGDLTWTNSDSTEVTANKDRTQINSSDYAPHNGEHFLVLSIRDTASEAWIELDFTTLTGMNKISFEINVWNNSLLATVKDTPNGLFILQVKDGENWVNLQTTNAEANLLPLLTFEEYVEVAFDVAGPGLYRIMYSGDSTATSNTITAVTVDNLKVFK